MVLLLTVLLMVCTFVAWLFYEHYYKPYYVIKKTLGLSGPPPSTFYGNFREILRLGYLESRRKWVSKYGTTFICYVGIKPMVVTQDVDIIKSVMVKNFDSFVNRSKTPTLFQGKNKKDLKSMLFLHDEEWRRMRRMLTPMFSSKKIKMMAPLIQESCERLNEKMSSISNRCKVKLDMFLLF